jgi:hypothetical protein
VERRGNFNWFHDVIADYAFASSGWWRQEGPVATGGVHVGKRQNVSRNRVSVATGKGRGIMAEVTVVWWRDIPAQVIAGPKRGGAKVKLDERFEQAIDRCAMKVGARDSDAYLAEWRKAPPYEVPGEPADVAAAEAARLEAEHDTARLKQLIDNDGWK